MAILISCGMILDLTSTDYCPANGDPEHYPPLLLQIRDCELPFSDGGEMWIDLNGVELARTSVGRLEPTRRRYLAVRAARMPEARKRAQALPPPDSTRVPGELEIRELY